MKITPLTELMHAVLDGEATSEETRELERQLAADPGARAEFDELKHLFDELARVPKAYPPEGLVSSVMASLAQQRRSEDGVRQPFTAPRVIGSTSRDAPDSGSGRSARDSGGSQQWPNFRSNEMSEQKGGSKRRIWIGGAIAAAAVVLVVSSGIDFPPGTKDTSGTIVPATRYRATQPGAEDVKLGAPTVTTTAETPSNPGTGGQGAVQAAGGQNGQNTLNGQNAQNGQNGQNGQNALYGQNGQNAQNALNAQNAQNSDGGQKGQNGQNAQNGLNAQNAQNSGGGQKGQNGQNAQNALNAQNAQNSGGGQKGQNGQNAQNALNAQNAGGAQNNVQSGGSRN